MGDVALRVVVADDAEVLCALLTRALDADPRLDVVGQAHDGRQALDVVVALRPDVLLLDLSMPVLDGTGVLAALRDLVASGAIDAAPAVVVLTGYGHADLGEQCAALGASAFVEKGSPLTEIRDALLVAAGRS